MNIRYDFQKVKLWGRKRLPCPVCGKKVRRHRTFYQTLNPFNQNPDGSQKTASEIRQELRVRIKDWEKQPDMCQACKNEDGEER